jgi:hypothetical protein
VPLAAALRIAADLHHSDVRQLDRREPARRLQLPAVVACPRGPGRPCCSGDGDEAEPDRDDEERHYLERSRAALEPHTNFRLDSSSRPHTAMTSQGTAQGRFDRAIRRRNLYQAELAIRELGGLASLHEALDYLDLLAEAAPHKVEQAAIRWHGRLEIEATVMTLAESHLALAALASLSAGEREAILILRKLLVRVRPTLTRRIG